jgi:outer membrane protein OmpA-like peptidoglycan-associated protein
VSAVRARPSSAERNTVHSSSVLRRLVVGVGVLALTAGMAGCTDAPEPTGGLAIVVGAHANIPAAELSGAADDALEAAVVAESYLSVVVADGEPFQTAEGRLLASDENSTARDQDRENNRRQARAELTEAAAKTPEVDLLTALDVAARSISSASGQHTLIVVDSGLSTVAPLDFTEPGLLDADPAALADGLKAAGALPDLTDVDRVVFQGLGDTAPPQQPISQAQRTNLKAIWQAVVAAAGGSSDVEDAPLTGDARPGLPWVTPVVPGPGPVCTVASVTFGEEDISFRADSAEFVDPDAVARTLQPIAARMAAEQLSATVTGTTARVGSDEGQRALSRQRAQAVADVLAGHAVPPGVLTVAGVGSDFPDYDEDDQAANRKVVIELAGAAAGVTCAAS